MRITDKNKLISTSRITADAFDLNRYMLASLMDKVLEAKTQTDRVYALNFMLRWMAEQQKQSKAS